MMQEYDLFDMAIELEEMRLDTNALFQELDGMVEDAHWDALESHEILVGMRNKLESASLALIQIQEKASILFLPMRKKRSALGA